jgi:hypothetical protein
VRISGFPTDDAVDRSSQDVSAEQPLSAPPGAGGKCSSNAVHRPWGFTPRVPGRGFSLRQLGILTSVAAVILDTRQGRAGRVRSVVPRWTLARSLGARGDAHRPRGPCECTDDLVVGPATYAVFFAGRDVARDHCPPGTLERKTSRAYPRPVLRSPGSGGVWRSMQCAAGPARFTGSYLADRAPLQRVVQCGEWKG